MQEEAVDREEEDAAPPLVKVQAASDILDVAPSHLIEETEGDLAILRALEMTQTQADPQGARGPEGDANSDDDDDHGLLDDLDDYLEAKQLQESHWAEAGEAGAWIHPDDEFNNEMEGGVQGAQEEDRGVKRPLFASNAARSQAGGPSKKRRTAEDILKELEEEEDDPDKDSEAGLRRQAEERARDSALAEKEMRREAKRLAEEQRRQLLIPRFDALEVTGQCISVTSVATGSRVYCHLGNKVISSSMHNQGGGGGEGEVGEGGNNGGCEVGKMLERSVAEMLREIDGEGLQRALAASRELAESLKSHLREDDLREDDLREDHLREDHAPMVGGGDPEPLNHPEGPNPHMDTKLWVNKYSPRSFLGLLSDEATNREVAKWVMSWDKEGGPRRVAEGPQGDPHHGSREGEGGGQGSGFRAIRDKVLLISGPPGLGKTTLAHVVASHCGYHPYEINASDDRSASALTERILDAIQMRSVMGPKGGRPNCVIVDEIDGVTGGQEGASAISALLKIVNATGGGGKGGRGGGKGAERGLGRGGEEEGSDEETVDPPNPKQDAPSKDAPSKDAPSKDAPSKDAPSKVDEEGGGGKKASKSKGGGSKSSKHLASLPPLRRPIICICNDLYAPALRPLRDSARVLYFKPPTRERLVQRLTQICALEGVHADKQALQVLCDRTECDIRSCMGTLQFLARRKGVHVNVKAVERLDIGTKDTTRSAMSVLGKLLQNPGGSASRGAKGSKWDRVNELWGEIISLGEHELLIDGLFENLHSVRRLDVDFKKTSKMADLMAEADIMMHQARHLGKYELLSFVPPLALRCHLIAAQPEKIRGGIVWPKAGGDIYRKSLVAGETLRSWSTSTLPHVAQCYSRESFLLEILPALKFILAPPLRPVAPHHLSPEEVKLLESTVGVLLGYGISYDFDVAAAQEEGLPSWALNHP